MPHATSWVVTPYLAVQCLLYCFAFSCAGQPPADTITLLEAAVQINTEFEDMLPCCAVTQRHESVGLCSACSDASCSPLACQLQTALTFSLYIEEMMRQTTHCRCQIIRQKERHIPPLSPCVASLCLLLLLVRTCCLLVMCTCLMKSLCSRGLLVFKTGKVQKLQAARART